MVWWESCGSRGRRYDLTIPRFRSQLKRSRVCVKMHVATVGQTAKEDGMNGMNRIDDMFAILEVRADGRAGQGGCD